MGMCVRGQATAQQSLFCKPAEFQQSFTLEAKWFLESDMH